MTEIKASYYNLNFTTALTHCPQPRSQFFLLSVENLFWLTPPAATLPGRASESPLKKAGIRKNENTGMSNGYSK